MKKAIVTIGVSASGKTTWAKQFTKENPSYRIICRDDIRMSLLGKTEETFLWSDWKFSRSNEDQVTQVANDMVDDFYSDSAVAGIIIADTNLNPKYRNILIKKLSKIGYEVETKVFHVTWEEATARDASRRNGVGISVLAKQFESYNSEFIKQYSPDSSKQKAVIVDLDGTLAHRATNSDGSFVRSHFDWDKVDTDIVDEKVLCFIRGLWLSNYAILVVSGRDGAALEKTNRWIQLTCGHDMISLDHIFLREKGDTRKDTIYKNEVFWNKIADNFNVVLAVDDRPCVCRLYRSIGIQVYQVSDPYLEF